MTDFDKALQSASQAILRRELTEIERVELLDLGAAIGMSTVKDYLYMLMIFKRYEDRISAQMLSFENEMNSKFDEMGVLENKIDATLVKTLDDMLNIMAGVFVEKADDLSAERVKVETWRSWGFVISGLVIFGAINLNAGYVMGSGFYPFWLQQGNRFHMLLSWFLNVPSGWILLFGSWPVLLNIGTESYNKIYTNERFGIHGRENVILRVKLIASTIALGTTGALVLYSTGLRLNF